MRVLIIDDCDDAAGNLALILELWGHEPRTARDADEGRAAADVFRPSAFLIDRVLPGEDGLSVARRFRDDPAHAAAAVVLMTGEVPATHDVEPLPAYLDRVMSKPLDLRALRAFLDAAHAPRRST